MLYVTGTDKQVYGIGPVATYTDLVGTLAYGLQHYRLCLHKINAAQQGVFFDDHSLNSLYRDAME